MLGLSIAFIIKHFMADFPLQTMEMVEDKGYYGRFNGILHAFIHGLCTYIILLWFNAYNIVTGPIIPINLLIFLPILDIIVHYHIDYIKMRINKQLNWGPENPNFWFSLGIDQMLHYLTYILIIYLTGI